MSATPVLAATAPRHLSSELELLFRQCFLDAERTVLVGGAEEPLYEPAAAPGELNRLYYREDFFASALHEIAHWCIAGPVRRRQRDFGYWYAPEGRDVEQQAAFEQVEVRPQALEWLLSTAAGYQFQLSVDNLDPETGRLPDLQPFGRAVCREVEQFRSSGLPARAAAYFEALRRHYDVRSTLVEMQFRLEDIVSP